MLDPKEWGLQTCDKNGKFVTLRKFDDFVDGDHMVLKTDSGCAHTANSHYPRTEFRQLKTWNSRGDAHLSFDVAIQKLPVKKPEVCFAQIKTATKEMQLLYHAGKVICRTLDARHIKMGTYKLGDWVHVDIHVISGQVDVKIGDATCGFHADFTGAYFKCGNYMQSNAAIEGNKTTGSEVWIKNISLKN